MRVRLTVDVDAHDRFIIARYFRTPLAKPRTRATRLQVQRFVRAALQTAVREQAANLLDARGLAVARRLAAQRQADADPIETLRDVREQQRSLAW